MVNVHGLRGTTRSHLVCLEVLVNHFPVRIQDETELLGECLKVQFLDGVVRMVAEGSATLHQTMVDVLGVQCFIVFKVVGGFSWKKKILQVSKSLIAIYV